jgi:hypothetical protein
MLNISSNETGFKETFEMKHLKDLELPNDNFLKIYALPISNSEFDYKKLKEIVANNIKNYVYSRREINEAIEKNVADGLYVKALNKFREIKNEKDNGSGSELGEILLYLFMECDLKAPKILSKMELKTNKNDYIKGADGVFLHSYEKDGYKVFDLVIGEAKIENSISNAISDAMDSIQDHISQEDFEVDLVNENIFKEKFNLEEAEELKKIIVPSNTNKKDVVTNKAFGIFIGYSLNANVENVSCTQAISIIEEEIEKNSNNILNNLKKKINQNNWNRYSFYVYILPFNNAKEDRKEIMKYILG